MLLGRAPLARQNPDICLSEGCIAESITERVDGGVDVAEAVGNVPDYRWNEVLMSSTKDGLHDSEHIVGGPSDEEDQEDERQCLCCFSLLLLFLKDFIII